MYGRSVMPVIPEARHGVPDPRMQPASGEGRTSRAEYLLKLRLLLQDTGVPASSVWWILRRNGLNRFSWIDRPTGQAIRRYERSASGELVHLDIKKEGKIPPGGSWRVLGRDSTGAKRKRRPVGYNYLHAGSGAQPRRCFLTKRRGHATTPTSSLTPGTVRREH